MEVIILVLLGPFVNAAAIVIGAAVGRCVKLAEHFQETIMHALGLAIMIIGISMGLKTSNALVPIASLLAGSILGELCQVEMRVAQVGDLLQRRLQHKKTAAGDFTEGFLTATLVFCVGAMAVIGGLNSGLRGDHQILYAKSILDGMLSVFFAASLGIGVAFSALPVFLYQGGIALLATSLAPLLSQPVVEEITATGGILILGIGLNMLGLTKIRVGNMLPAIVFAAVIAWYFL